MIVYVGSGSYAALPDDPYYQDWIQGARTARSAADTFVVGCPADRSCKTYSDWWQAASRGYYFEGIGPGSFASAIHRFVIESIRTKIATLQVDEQMPGALGYRAGSAWPVPVQVDAPSGRLRWSFTAPISDVITLTYRVQPQAVGVFTFTGGSAVVTDTLQQALVLPLPTGMLTVTGPCDPPTATPTTAHPPTHTPTPTLTAEPPTVTPSPTATRLPQPVYLPVALWEECIKSQRRVDVTLVIDASTSMLDEASPGRSKIDAAKAAAGAFLDELDAGDQAAIVAFNSQARLLQQLTSDRAALRAAIAAITAAPQTCIVCAVDVAADELASDRRDPDHTPVLILLTDGKSNPRPVSEAEDRADEAKRAGVVIFTIGLGDDLDFEALGRIASKPAYYHHAPDAEELAGIYKAIAVAIPCPVDRYWGWR